MNMKKKGDSGQMLHMRRVSWLTGPSVSKSSSRTHGSHPYGRYGQRKSSPAGKGQEAEKVHHRTGTLRKHKNSLNKSSMYPKFNQVFLAFSTLLFFVSFESLLFMVFTINPGLIARSFSPGKCKIIQKGINGNISCYVESFVDHGNKVDIPCLQVYVVPVESDENEDASNVQQNDFTRTPSDSSDNRVAAPLNAGTDRTNAVDCESNCSTGEPKPLTTEKVLLLYQSEYNFAGLDNLYRRCSYLPSVCLNDVEQMMSDICNYGYELGEPNTTIECYVDRSKERVIRKKTLNTSDIIHALLWPAVGVAASIGCCIGFWKRNHNHISRLYIYNSWAAS